MKNIKKDRWTTKEIEALKKYYGSEVRNKIMKIIKSKTWPAIQHKALRMKIRRKYPTSIPWDKKEVTFIRNNYRKLSIKKMSEFLNTSRTRVYHKMLDMGLGTPSRISFIKVKMTETEKAYIAGFIDGEGTITYHPHWRKDGRMWGATPLVGIANTCKEPLTFIAKILQKNSSRDFEKIIRIHKEKRPHKRDLWEFKIEGRYPIKNFLKAIQPYLIIKKRHTEIMLELLDSRDIGTRWTRKQLKLLLEICNLQGISRVTKLKHYLSSTLSDWRTSEATESVTSPST